MFGVSLPVVLLVALLVATELDLSLEVALPLYTKEMPIPIGRP